MYGPKWPFLFRYESRDTRRINFPRVEGLSFVNGHPGFGASHNHCKNRILQCDIQNI